MHRIETKLLKRSKRFTSIDMNYFSTLLVFCALTWPKTFNLPFFVNSQNATITMVQWSFEKSSLNPLLVTCGMFVRKFLKFTKWVKNINSSKFILKASPLISRCFSFISQWAIFTVNYPIYRIILRILFSTSLD